MKFNLRNITDSNKRIRIIPKNSSSISANIGVDNPTASIDENGVFSVCLAPQEENDGFLIQAGQSATMLNAHNMGYEGMPNHTITLTVTKEGLTSETTNPDLYAGIDGVMITGSPSGANDSHALFDLTQEQMDSENGWSISSYQLTNTNSQDVLVKLESSDQAIERILII